MPRFPFRLYLGRRMLVLAGLGFSSGLPSAWKILVSTLQVWLNDLGIKLETVTGITRVTYPIGLKVLWAPLLDRYVPPFLGRRRGWLLVFQVLLAAGIAGIALVGPESAGDSLVPLAIAATVVAFLSASQDVVADAYRADVLPAEERAAGAGMFVTGYRVALLVAGSGALLLSEVLPWRAVYGVLAALLGVGVVATLAAEEPASAAVRPASLREAVAVPFLDLSRRFGRSFVLVLLFVALFRLPDGVANVLTVPFLQTGLEFGKGEIALVREGLGLGFGIAGALVAGPLTARLGVIPALWVFGALQAASNLGFSLLAAVGKSLPVLVGVVAVENFCGGLVAAGFVAYLMGLCDRRYSATQYALFTGLMFLVSTEVGARSGELARAVGFGPAFAVTAALGLPGMALLPFLPRTEAARPSPD